MAIEINTIEYNKVEIIISGSNDIKLLNWIDYSIIINEEESHLRDL